KALVEKDTTALKQLLHLNVSYGHSNGWVQTKTEVVSDLRNGKMAYTKIDNADAKWIVSKDWATRRSTTQVTYLLEGKEGNLKLHVLQVWMKANGRWQLIARQGAKI
ncbi:MAG: nuclear transport factor 2 family protein, partial [Bacteroidota bacterium]